MDCWKGRKRGMGKEMKREKRRGDGYRLTGSVLAKIVIFFGGFFGNDGVCVHWERGVLRYQFE